MSSKFKEILKDRACLIVDSKVDARSATKKYLQGFGVEDITTAIDGDAATELIKEHDYDLIICEYNLGKGKDGQQVLEESRYTSSLKNTCCFIIVTSETAKDMVMGAIENQPDEYITKPYSAADFQNRIRQSLLVKDLLKDVNQNIDSENFEKAIEICRDLLKQKSPIELRVLRILARELIRIEKYDDALEIYGSIVEDHKFHWARLGLAKCYKGKEDYDEALDILEQTIKEYPNYVQCYDLMADINESEGMDKLAQENLEKAVSKAPRSVLRQMRLGQIAFKNKSMETAENAFKEATRIGKHSCYITIDTFTNYIKTLQRKIEDENTRESNSAVAEATKATDFIRERYFDEESYVFESEILDSITYKNRGLEDKAIASTQRAQKMLQESTSLNNVRQRVTLLEAFVNTNQTKEAKTLISSLEKEKTLQREYQWRLGRAKEANQIFENKKSPEELNEDGISYYSEGDYRKAMLVFDELAREKEASDIALLNAIQARVAVMEEEFDEFILRGTEKFINRIGFLGPKNPSRKRLTELKKRIAKLESDDS